MYYADNAMKLLLIEDDPKVAQFIKAELLQKDHSIELTQSGLEGGKLARKGEYDVLIIDRMLPDTDGATVIKELRRDKIDTPIIVLSAMDGINHRVDGLEAGADDYLVKPFAFEELYARICTLVRRRPVQDPGTALRVSGLELDLVTRKVSYEGRELELQTTEYRLLEFLMRRTGQVVTRGMLLEGVWDFSFDPKTSLVETHVSRLRNKLESICPKTIIHTVRGSGYRIDEV